MLTLSCDWQDGLKMGKSLGNVLDPSALVAAYGADAVRFFFLKEVDFGQVTALPHPVPADFHPYSTTPPRGDPPLGCRFLPLLLGYVQRPQPRAASVPEAPVMTPTGVNFCFS